MKYRVLWRDAAGEGRFFDVEADNEGSAAWQAAMSTGSDIAEFAGVLNLAAPAVQTLLTGRWNTEGTS